MHPSIHGSMHNIRADSRVTNSVRDIPISTQNKKLIEERSTASFIIAGLTTKFASS
jgi:hypothetical protein